MRDFVSWVKRNMGAVTLVVVVLLFAFYMYDRDQAAVHARRDACHLIEANDNGLISAVTPAPTPAKRADAQARLDEWAKFVDANSGVFQCHMHFLPAP